MAKLSNFDFEWANLVLEFLCVFMQNTILLAQSFRLVLKSLAVLFPGHQLSINFIQLQAKLFMSRAGFHLRIETGLGN